MRTDEHNNPTAFTTDIAIAAGLEIGKDFEKGKSFTVAVGGNSSATYYTAKLLGDPIEVTIKVIDKIGFITKYGQPRWVYINMPKWLWDTLDHDKRVKIIGWMYHHEGGSEMKNLFPPYES